MGDECEVYVDPDEDEVFFGCIGDKERSIYAKVSKQEGGKRDDFELKKQLCNNPCDEMKIEEGNERLNITDVKIIDKTREEVVKNDTLENGDSNFLSKDLNGSLNNDEESSVIGLNNTSVELDHNYSTPMKQKIDKSILSTPKSIVKADKDGGFLKVLSEIALVKAEAEMKSEDNKKNDENKENQIIHRVPEIKITEASPEKISIKSPQSKSQKTNFKRIKIVYNSPKSPEKRSPKRGSGSKALADNFESSRNLKNKCLDNDMNKSNLKEVENIMSNNVRGSREFLNKLVNLISFNDSKEDFESMKELNDMKIEERKSVSPIHSPEKGNKSLNGVNMLESEELSLQCVSSDKVNDGQNIDENDDEIQIIVELNTDTNTLGKESSKEDLIDTIIAKGTVSDSNPETNDGKVFEINFLPDPKSAKSEEIKNEEIRAMESSQEISEDSKSEVKKFTRAEEKPAPKYRFSKEARKIVEGLKNATADDTLNFTIQEIDVENTENSFLSPEPVPCFDETVIAAKNVQSIMDIKKTPKILPKSIVNRPKTVEANRKPFTPVLSQSKIPSVKYLSDRKIHEQRALDLKKCAKKLPLEEKRTPRTPRIEEKLKGCGKTLEKDSNSVSSSRIPVFGLKACKTVANMQSVSAKTTPLKSYKNPKFKNIESPINAYIHNKPTALVVNVKPEPKKDALTEVWRKQTFGSGKKVEEKNTNGQSAKKVAPATVAAALPFVQYKSATPYKVEKRPESRLPRLAPSVQKLIGYHSPRILKHEGRFYMKTPRQQVSYEDNTIVADANEVSVVVSQVAQKSNTIK